MLLSLAENPPPPHSQPLTLPAINNDRSCNGHGFGNDCSDKQRAICIINAWGYKETCQYQ